MKEIRKVGSISCLQRVWNSWNSDSGGSDSWAQTHSHTASHSFSTENRSVSTCLRNLTEFGCFVFSPMQRSLYSVPPEPFPSHTPSLNFHLELLLSKTEPSYIPPNMLHLWCPLLTPLPCILRNITAFFIHLCPWPLFIISFQVVLILLLND